MRRVAIALLLALIACGPEPQQAPRENVSVADRSSPFGLWSTERGQTVEVFRDGTFQFCDGELCETGQYERYNDQSRSVFLIGFSSMPVTQRLRELSGWEPAGFPPDVTPERLQNSYQLGDGGMEEGFRNRLCQGRPCKIVGRAEGDVYRFVKLRDY